MRSRASRLTVFAREDVEALKRAGFTDEDITEMRAASVLEAAKAIRQLEQASGRPMNNKREET